MALLSRFFGRTASEGAAYAFGVATGPVLAPATETIRQEAWSTYKSRALSWGDVAGIVAEDVEQAAWGSAEVGRTGLNEERFQALLGEALNAPGLSELYQMWRRGQIDDAGFAHGLRKAKLETRWDEPLKALHDVLLTPSELANARQQGFVTEARQKAEAALQGVTADRADIQFELSGLPPGVQVMQHAANRGLVDQPTFDQAIREGHTKTKYTDLLWQLRNPLLSAATYVRLYLKGWITQAEMDAGGAQWGYTSDQMNQWYLSEGRPATAHQIHIGYARGATLPGVANEEAAIRKSVAESDIRPEYADIIYASRYSLPSAFALRGLVESGAITAARGEEILIQSGWPPDLSKEVADSWSGAGTAAKPKEDPYVKKADGTLFTALHKAYVKTGAARTGVEPILEHLLPVQAIRDEVFTDWDLERQANQLPAVTA